MKVAVISLNQRRHNWFVRRLAEAVDEVVLLQETMTLAPGAEPGFFKKSNVMQSYFSKVIAAEEKVFGPMEWLPHNVSCLAMPFGDLKNVPEDMLNRLSSCDAAIVFGGSFIKGQLLDILMRLVAVNVHLGITPHYRGSSSNFWACYDGRPDMIGATVHQLSDQLDGGGILFQIVPQPMHADYFAFSMMAVRAALEEVIVALCDGSLRSLVPITPKFSATDRVTKNAEFTDEVAADFLDSAPSPEQIYNACLVRNECEFVRLRVR